MIFPWSRPSPSALRPLRADAAAECARIHGTAFAYPWSVAEMEALIARTRAPYESKLGERLAVSEGLLYRRGNFNGSFDQLILDALIAEKDAEIAFSPGFRWGTTIMPGEAITMENLLDQTAITYPYVTLTPMKGSQIKQILEDVGDNLFNADPYYQQLSLIHI